MKEDRTSSLSLWSGQALHILCLAILLAATSLAWAYLGKPFPRLFWIAVSFPIVHQIFVWIAWRLELQSAATSKTIGFHGYVALFFLLFGGRFI
jgi:hypothetical protein